MGFLKGLALTILSLFLFFGLTVMGFAYTVHETALNPRFVTATIDEMDFARIARETLDSMQKSDGEKFPPGLQDAVISAIDGAQPALKKSLRVAVDDMYAFMLGKADAPNLKVMLRDSFANTQFLESVLQGMDLQQIMNQFIKEQSQGGDPAQKAFQDAIITTIGKIQPSLKKQIVAASDPVFKYLLSDTSTIDLKGTVRRTLLSQEFLTEVINNLDIKALTKDMVGDQLNAQLPNNVRLTNQEIDQIIAALEPPVKQGLTSSAGQLADYLVGLRQDFTIRISTGSVMNNTAKSIARQAFMRQLPPELLGQSQSVVNTAFDVFWASAQSSFPTSFDLDSSMFGQGIPRAFSDGLNSVRDGLAEARESLDNAESGIIEKTAPARQYIHLFQLAYLGLIAFLVIVAGLIILIKRSVRGATRDLGITVTVYGAMEFAGIILLRNLLLTREFLATQLPPDTPRFAGDMAYGLLQRITQPYFNFVLGALIVGVALLVVSFVYRENKPVPAQPAK